MPPCKALNCAPPLAPLQVDCADLLADQRMPQLCAEQPHQAAQHHDAFFDSFEALSSAVQALPGVGASKFKLADCLGDISSHYPGLMDCDTASLIHSNSLLDMSAPDSLLGVDGSEMVAVHT